MAIRLETLLNNEIAALINIGKDAIPEIKKEVSDITGKDIYRFGNEVSLVLFNRNRILQRIEQLCVNLIEERQRLGLLWYDPSMSSHHLASSFQYRQRLQEMISII